MELEQVPVCTIDGATFYGSPMERDAALLNEGDEIYIDGTLEVVDYIWFYDGVIVKLKSGKSLFPSLGQSFERTAQRRGA